MSLKVKVTRDKKWHFPAACVQFMVSKTSLATSLNKVEIFQALKSLENDQKCGKVWKNL